MKKVLFAMILLFLQTSIFSQASTDYFANIEAAQQAAQEEAKPILMVFAGSDWCRPCMKFKKDILESEVFQDYWRESLIVLYLDFPAKRKNQLSKAKRQHNERLAETYNRAGAFPQILLLNADAQLLGELPYLNQSPAQFIAQCQKISSHENVPH